MEELIKKIIATYGGTSVALDEIIHGIVKGTIKPGGYYDGVMNFDKFEDGVLVLTWAVPVGVVLAGVLKDMGFTDE